MNSDGLTEKRAEMYSKSSELKAAKIWRVYPEGARYCRRERGAVEGREG